MRNCGERTPVALDTKILIVEDDKISAELFRRVLEHEGYTVFISYDGLDIHKSINEHDLDIILLDIILPDTNGYDILQSLQNAEDTKNIPVIMMTSLNSAQDVKKALDLGALDYIRKPCEPIELIARIHSALRLKLKQDLLNEFAQRDALTHLYNRWYFNQIIDKLISDKGKYAKGIAFVMLDCDHFKKVNDRYGHTTGDEVLEAVANVLSKSVKKADIACRFGGEEFCLILLDTSISQAYMVAERIRTNVEKIPFIFKYENFTVTVSCGVSHTQALDDKSTVTLVTESDTALYEAKKNGRNRTEIYKEDDELVAAGHFQ